VSSSALFGANTRQSQADWQKMPQLFEFQQSKNQLSFFGTHNQVKKQRKPFFHIFFFFPFYSSKES
jgi:hypothetical protein